MAPLPAPLRVPPPVRLRMLCLRLAQPRNPPRLGGFLLALLLRVLAMTRRGLSLRPASLRVSPLPVTLRLRVWLTSSLRSALPRVRSLTSRLRVANLRLGSASLRLRLRGSASACTPAWRRCWEEVAARSESLARRSRPLSRVIPARARAYAMADDAIFTSSQPVNSAFSQLVGSRYLGARRLWIHRLLRDGEAGASVPGSARGDVLVPLADVWHSGCVEEGWFSTFLTLPSSTRPCLRCLPLCPVRLGQLLLAPLLSGPSAGRACWPIPLSLFLSHRSVT